MPNDNKTWQSMGRVYNFWDVLWLNMGEHIFTCCKMKKQRKTESNFSGLNTHCLHVAILAGNYLGLCVKPIQYIMMTSSNGNILRVTGHLYGEFTGRGEFPTHGPVTRSFNVFFDLRLNKWLSKQSWGWWFEMLARPLWRHRNVCPGLISEMWSACFLQEKTLTLLLQEPDYLEITTLMLWLLTSWLLHIARRQ